MDNFDYRKYLKEGRLFNESLSSFPDEEGQGIFITGFGEGDLFLTTNKDEWEEMKAESPSTESGMIKGNGSTIYYSFGVE